MSFFFLVFELMTIIRTERWSPVPRRRPAQIRGVAHPARAEERDLGRRQSVAETQPRSSMDRFAVEPDLVSIF